MNAIVKNIPNSITCLNLVSGLLAVAAAFQGNGPMWGLSGYQWCWIFIGIAAVADFLDGFAARLLHAYSSLGKELDSLCDLVSFGVAPAMLILNTMLHHGVALPLCLVTLMIPVCGAIRLAKFNNDTEQATVFRGLPIPANALFWIGVYGWCQSYTFPGWTVIAVLVVLVSLAMTARFKMFSLKFKNFNFAENFIRYVMLLMAVAFVVLYGLSGLIWTVLLYLLLSLMKQRRL